MGMGLVYGNETGVWEWNLHMGMGLVNGNGTGVWEWDWYGILEWDCAWHCGSSYTCTISGEYMYIVIIVSHLSVVDFPAVVFIVVPVVIQCQCSTTV